MTKQEFKDFCKQEFYKRGFKKIKNEYYLAGDEVLCGIHLQKSDYSNVYYVNFYYFIGDYRTSGSYPKYCDSDVGGRIVAMSKTRTNGGKNYRTAQIEYEEYDQDELRAYFDVAFEEVIMPPLMEGKKYILDNLRKKYTMTLRQDEILKKLQE